MTWFFIKLAIRFLIFGVVFGVAAHRSQNISIRPRRALPLVALVFAGMNAGLYWALEPLLNLATLGMIGFLVPLVVNGVFLYVTARLLGRWLEIKGIRALVWLAVLLTLAHGVLYVALDVIP